MTDALVDTITEYLNNVEISPGTSNEDGSTENRNRRQVPVTALTLPEPLQDENEDRLDVEKDLTNTASAITNAAIINHKLNTGILYRDYISDSSDLNSDTSSVEDQQHQRQQQFRQSTGDLTLISKAVSIDTHNSSDVSSAVVPAQRNPVSDLLRSPSSSLDSEDEDIAMTEYYSTETLKSKVVVTDSKTIVISETHHRQQHQVNKLVSTTNNETPSPPPSSSLKKILIHHDHKIIPDNKDTVEANIGSHMESVPHSQPNIESSRFITMEEELEVNDRLYNARVHGDTRKPNNMSVVDLSLNASLEKVSPIRTEIRSLEQRRSIKRLNAIKELMETEETYSRDLGILCTVSYIVTVERIRIITNL